MRDADTTLAILAVLLQTLPNKPTLSYDWKLGYQLHYGPEHSSYMQGFTLTELTDKGR